MRRRREYMGATGIDADSLIVNSISVEDPSGRCEARSLEVIDLAIQMIQLASKRGRVKQSFGEVVNEAA